MEQLEPEQSSPKITSVEVVGSNVEYMPTFPVGKTLGLAPGVNVVVGTNDRGKSVFLRAISDAIRFKEMKAVEDQRPYRKQLDGQMGPAPMSFKFMAEEFRMEEAVKKGLGLILALETDTEKLPRTNLVTCEKTRDGFKGIREVETPLLGGFKHLMDPSYHLSLFGRPVERVDGGSFENVLGTIIARDTDLLLLDEPTSRWGLGKGLIILKKVFDTIETDEKQIVVTEHSPIALAFIANRIKQDQESTRHKVFHFLRDCIEEGAVGDLSLNRMLREDVPSDQIDDVLAQIKLALEDAKCLF